MDEEAALRNTAAWLLQQLGSCLRAWLYTAIRVLLTCLCTAISVSLSNFAKLQSLHFRKRDLLLALRDERRVMSNTPHGCVHAHTHTPCYIHTRAPAHLNAPVPPHATPPPPAPSLTLSHLCVGTHTCTALPAHHMATNVASSRDCPRRV